jgi:hypothetical protein
MVRLPGANSNLAAGAGASTNSRIRMILKKIRWSQLLVATHGRGATAQRIVM